ncbi:hypothetical protein K501DRAFT_334208 [Backusella circina FSU 941]|nr:hypothetical protein K501DRAFT_334208 [Backusella circina FSU 941]
MENSGKLQPVSLRNNHHRPEAVLSSSRDQLQASEKLEEFLLFQEYMHDILNVYDDTNYKDGIFKKSDTIAIERNDSLNEAFQDILKEAKTVLKLEDDEYIDESVVTLLDHEHNECILMRPSDTTVIIEDSTKLECLTCRSKPFVFLKTFFGYILAGKECIVNNHNDTNLSLFKELIQVKTMAQLSVVLTIFVLGFESSLEKLKKMWKLALEVVYICGRMCQIKFTVVVAKCINLEQLEHFYGLLMTQDVILGFMLLHYYFQNLELRYFLPYCKPPKPQLLVAITTNLSFSDKLTCTKVCREWNSVVRNTILIREVEFSCSQRYRIFTERVKNKVFLGSQVRKLVLNTDDLKWNDFRKIPILFSRLEEFVCTGSGNLEFMLYDCNDKEEDKDFHVLQPWSTNLKKLDIFAMRGFIPELFDTLSFNSLTHLRLDFPITGGPSYYYNHTIDALSEMPCLISLDLTTFEIDFKKFERIHANAPNLIQLGLYHFQLSVYDDEDVINLSKIDRAIHIKSLNLYNWCMLAGPDFFWLDYFVHKYPNLEHLVMDGELGGYNFFENMHDNTNSAVEYKLFDIKMLNVLNKCPIKKIRMLKQYMTPAILQKIEANQVRLTGIYMTAQPDSVCALPTKQIMNSPHIHSFEKMIIHHLDSAFWNYTLPMIRLKKLELICQGESFSSLSLDLILNQCPVIEKIHLGSAFITTAASEIHDYGSQQQRTTTVSCKLSKLILNNTLVDNQVFSFISQSCPLLKSLQLEDCRSTTDATNIHLPNHCLHQLSIKRQRGPYYCRVTTASRKGHYAIFGPPLALVVHDLDEEFSIEKIENSYCFDVNFYCKSLTHLFINHMQPY